ncbi:MAG: hypothetical protein LAO79_25000 [Acidobacteriia bacterium]|nr:hypothetical protein [Terriglobia bacterium]
MSNRVVFAAIAVAVLAVCAAVKSYDLSTQQAADPYGVTAGETRFSAALDALPASGVVGYLSDMPIGENVGSIAYMAAQYAVAPRAIVPIDKLRAEWALGNFARPGNFAERGAQAGYRIVRDFGNGVVVYRKAQP